MRRARRRRKNGSDLKTVAIGVVSFSLVLIAFAATGILGVLNVNKNPLNLS